MMIYIPSHNNIEIGELTTKCSLVFTAHLLTLQRTQNGVTKKKNYNYLSIASLAYICASKISSKWKFKCISFNVHYFTLM